MNILIVGSGGREHSLAWAIKQNPKCDTLIVAPGNAGISEITECIYMDILDNSKVLQLVKNRDIDLVIIGPEGPLANGLSDTLIKENVLTFGASKAAAELESSKAFTKSICSSINAPTANYGLFRDKEKAKQYVRHHGLPIVIKADGLAAGKGVVVAMDQSTAFKAIEDMLDGAFGVSSAEILIEEFMDGEEASFFVLSDGKNILPIGTAQDHKRAFDGDLGPNTGGMGAYSPAPILNTNVVDITLKTIIQPTIDEMARRGTPYIGVLYAGLMIKNGVPRLVEYNARFGDPECQVLMMRLGAQILDLILACLTNNLLTTKVQWAEDYAITVVMASKGYPSAHQNGSTINIEDGLVYDSQQMVFHAGTVKRDNILISNGGRVLNITARGESLLLARDKAYQIVKKISWPEGYYRSDIGWKAL
jgi:phosphoribosylamine--glycine ligase